MFTWITVAKDIFYLGAIIFSFWLFYRERQKLLDRIMSKSYEEYKYYQDMFREEVDELKKMRKEAREDREEKDEMTRDLESIEPKPVDLSQFEEDWAESDVDTNKLKHRMD